MARSEDVTPDEVDLLAELDAGSLEGDELARAEALASTEGGQTVLAALARVRADLAAVPAPELPGTWPATFADALQSERKLRAPRSRRRSWLVAQWSVGLAAVIALGAVVVTGAVTGGVPTGGQAGDATSAAGGAAESAPGGTARQESAAPATPPLFTTGRDYSAGDLPDDVAALTRDPLAAATPEAAATPGRGAGGYAADGADTASAAALGLPRELEELTAPDRLADCLRALTSEQQEPVAVDLARFEGTPAVVVVARDAGSGVTTTFVAGPRCSAATPDLRHVSAP